MKRIPAILFVLPFFVPFLRAESGSPPPAEIGKEALTILKDAMQDEDSDVRACAAQMWGSLGNPASIPLLKEALEDLNGHVRIAAAESLWALGDDSGIAVLKGIVREAPAPKGKRGPVFQMQALVKNKVRASAIWALSETQGKEAIPFLEKFRKDSSGMVRDQAAVSLARLGRTQDIQKFVDALKDPDVRVRIAGAEALAEIGDPSTLESLKKASSDSSRQVRALVMKALGAVGSPIGLPEIREHTKDPDDLVRVQAVEALSRIQNPAAFTFLEEVYGTDPSPYMKLIAMAGLARRGKAFSDLAILESALKKQDQDLKLMAVEVLGFLSGEESLDFLRRVLRDQNRQVRVRAAAAVVKKLQNPR